MAKENIYVECTWIYTARIYIFFPCLKICKPTWFFIEANTIWVKNNKNVVNEFTLNGLRENLLGSKYAFWLLLIARDIMHRNVCGESC